MYIGRFLVEATGPSVKNLYQYLEYKMFARTSKSRLCFNLCMLIELEMFMTARSQTILRSDYFFCFPFIGASRGVPGVGPPFFWPINAFELGHIVGTPPPLSWVGNPPFSKWLDPPLPFDECLSITLTLRYYLKIDVLVPP